MARNRQPPPDGLLEQIAHETAGKPGSVAWAEIIERLRLPHPKTGRRMGIERAGHWRVEVWTMRRAIIAASEALTILEKTRKQAAREAELSVSAGTTVAQASTPTWLNDPAPTRD